MVKRGDELPEEPEDEKPILHVGGAQAVYTENIPRQIQYTALGAPAPHASSVIITFARILQW